MNKNDYSSSLLSEQTFLSTGSQRWVHKLAITTPSTHKATALAHIQPHVYLHTGILVPWLQRAGPGLERAQQSFRTMNTMTIRQQLSEAVGCVSPFPKVLTQYLSRPVGVLTTGWLEQPVWSCLRSYQKGGRSRPNKQVNKHGLQSIHRNSGVVVGFVPWGL